LAVFEAEPTPGLVHEAGFTPVSGRDPKSGPVILASNHQAVADSFFLALMIRRQVRFVAKAEYFTGTGI
jgi:1-acyl-sn-glycerol-3-phosphate acyltransferase